MSYAHYAVKNLFVAVSASVNYFRVKGLTVPPLSRILFFRCLFEMLFPILFGLSALILGFVVRRIG